MNRFRLLSTATVALAVLLAIALVPLPHHELSSVTIQPRGAERVYVDVPGVLRSVTVDAGDAVTGGEELAVLENPEVAQQLARLRGERQRLEQRLQNLGRQRTESDDEAARIPHTRQALASVEERLARLQEEQQRLRVVSRRGGTVIPAAYVPGEAADRSALPTWSGTLLDEMNLDRWLESGTLICLVGDVERMEAVLVVDQSQVEFVREGQLVELMLDEYPGETWKGRIDAVAHIDLRVAPRELSRSAGGDLNTEVDASGNERLASAAYQARVPLENSEQRLLPGFRGRAKIRVGERSLGEMLLRYLAATLRFG